MRWCTGSVQHLKSQLVVRRIAEMCNRILKRVSVALSRTYPWTLYSADECPLSPNTCLKPSPCTDWNVWSTRAVQPTQRQTDHNRAWCGKRIYQRRGRPRWGSFWVNKSQNNWLVVIYAVFLWHPNQFILLLSQFALLLPTIWSVRQLVASA